MHKSNGKLNPWLERIRSNTACVMTVIRQYSDLPAHHSSPVIIAVMKLNPADFRPTVPTHFRGGELAAWCSTLLGALNHGLGQNSVHTGGVVIRTISEVIHGQMQRGVEGGQSIQRQSTVFLSAFSGYSKRIQPRL